MVPWAPALKWGLGGWLVWNLLPPESKENIRLWLYQLNMELAASQRRKAEQEKIELIRRSLLESFQKQRLSLTIPQSSEISLPPLIELISISRIHATALTVPQPHIETKAGMEPDSIWLKRIIHPSIVLILGKRGSGKSALAYRLDAVVRTNR